MFDIIGDVHGCYEELIPLLKQLGLPAGMDGLYHQSGPAAGLCGRYYRPGAPVHELHYSWSFAMWRPG